MKKKIIIASIVSLFILLSILGHKSFITNKTVDIGEDIVIGASYSDASWSSVNSFQGFQTNKDPQKIPVGANPVGQNTTVNDGDRISLRKFGYQTFPSGDASTSTDEIKSLHVFRKRSGESIMMRSSGTIQEYYEEDNDTWETLRISLTSEKEFGYADYNINTDLVSYVYFGNGYDDWASWNGNHTILNGVLSGGESAIVVDSTTGFPSSGTIIYCDVELAYASKTATQFNVTSAHACADNRGVAEAVVTDGSNPKGNIYLTANNRVFIAGITDTENAVFFSEYGDATNYVGAVLVTESTATSPGIFNLGEGGGPVTGMALDENSIYIFKKPLVYKATLTDALYTLTALKTFDGKSQTTGNATINGVFTGQNNVYFATPDNQIMSLGRVETLDFPQIIPISKNIEETVKTLDFTAFDGIVFQDKAYFTMRSSTSISNNDTVLVWDIKHKHWDSPYIGINASKFIVYDDGSGEDLYFGSSNSKNVYLVNSTALDDIYSVKGNWRSKSYTFDTPYSQKQIVDLYVEGYITSNTTLNIKLLLDGGYTQSFSTDLVGTETAYLYSESVYNAFGLSRFGLYRFGSNPDQTDKKKFRVYLGKDFRPSPFYDLAIEFTSDGEAQDWEVLSFAFKIRPYSQVEKRQLYKAFK